VDEIHELKGWSIRDERLRRKGNKVRNMNISGRTALGGWGWEGGEVVAHTYSGDWYITIS